LKHNFINMIPSPSDQQPTLTATISADFLSKYQVEVPLAFASAFRAEPSLLPEHYQPSDYDVVCGRGKGSYNRPGNKRFRAIVRQHIPEYQATKTKFDKSSVLYKIINCVKNQENGNARFVSCRKGRYYEITDDKAREKVGHCLRETIALLEQQQSRSSTDSVGSCSDSMEGRQEKQRTSKSDMNFEECDLLLERQRAIVDGLLSSTLKRKRHVMPSPFQQHFDVPAFHVPV